MLCAVLLVDKTGVMLFGLVAVMIHEAGHFVFMLFAKKKIESAAFQLGGIIIKSRGFSGYGYEFLVAFGGCFFNLICCVFSLILYLRLNKLHFFNTCDIIISLTYAKNSAFRR